MSDYSDIILQLEDKDYRVRVKAAESLGELGDVKAIEPLVKALQDEDEDVRKCAVIALEKIGDKRAVVPLVKALQDDFFKCREYAAEALGRIGDKSAVQPLIKSLQDVDVDVRVNAAEALGLLGDKRAVGPLIGALEDETESVRINAAMALGKLGDKKAIAPLHRALENQTIDIQPVLFGALFLLGEESYSAEIIKSIENSNTDVRKHAAEILGYCGIKQSIITLSNRLEVELDDNVREAINSALTKLRICSLQMSINPHDSMTGGEWGNIPVTFCNQGDVVVNDICLSVRGPVDYVEKTLNYVRPHETKSTNISIKPKELGHVPVVFEYKYKDEDGNQKSESVQSTLQVKTSSDSKVSTNHQVIVHGNYEVVESGGIKATDSVVTNKATEGGQDIIPFIICPYCGKKLKLPKTPKFCPYCAEKLGL